MKPSGRAGGARASAFPAPPVLTLVLLLGWLGTAAAGAAPPLAELLNSSPYSSGDRARVLQWVEEAEAAGVPPELLIPRIEEGLAKRASAERLLEVLSLERARLERARRLLSGLPEGGKLAADRAAWLRTANLIAWGAGDEEITALAAASLHRAADYGAVTSLFAALVQWGLSRPAALELTVAASSSPLPAADLPALVQILSAGRRARMQPDEIVASLLAELPRAATARELRKRVLYE